MFYEERIIDGILHSRTKPDAAFEPVSQRQLTMLLTAARGRIKELERDAREDARSAATEARWQERQGEEYGSY